MSKSIISEHDAIDKSILLLQRSVSTSSAMVSSPHYYGEEYDDSMSDDEVVNMDATECYYGHWKSDMRTGQYAVETTVNSGLFVTSSPRDRKNLTNMPE